MVLTERTSQEIQDQIQRVAANDFLGFEQSDLIEYVPFALAKSFLKEGVTEAKWAECRAKTSPQEAIRDYLPFAWGKANDNRGLSASRSISHMKAWLWLAGYTEAADTLFDDYEFYGKPQLVLASELVGFDWTTYDDGRWTNSEDSDGLAESDRDRLVERVKGKAQKFLGSRSAA